MLVNDEEEKIRTCHGVPRYLYLLAIGKAVYRVLVSTQVALFGEEQPHTIVYNRRIMQGAVPYLG